LPETKFLELAKICDNLTQTPKTLKKIEIVSNFLKKIDIKEISPAIFLILGTTFSETDPRTLDINWKSLDFIVKAKKQKTLFQEPLTINSVYRIFSKIAEISGRGSKRKKKDLLITLFSQASPIEKKYLIGNIFNEMRHGVKEGVMLKAISKASGIDFSIIKRAYVINGNIGKIGQIAIETGEEGLKQVKIEIFRPIKPMLGEILDDLNLIFVKNDKDYALEFKYDGVRVQIHKSDQKVEIFTRQLKNITRSFPEVVEAILKNIKEKKVILEGELIAIGKNERPLPFQELIHRFRRIYEINKLQQLIPVKLVLFDIIMCNDKSFLNISNKNRWEFLTKITNNLNLAERIITNDLQRAKEFYKTAISKGHEGVMIKDLSSYYSPGERKKDWLKLKSEIRLDLIIVAADWGSGRRKGWLSNYHLAVIDEQDNFRVIGKTFKGLTDQEFKQMTEELLRLKINENDYTVFVVPKIVVEIAFNEIQKSPQYESGYALRFARIKKIRFDKNPNEITRLNEIKYLYTKQFEKKGRI